MRLVRYIVFLEDAGDIVAKIPINIPKKYENTLKVFDESGKRIPAELVGNVMYIETNVTDGKTVKVVYGDTVVKQLKPNYNKAVKTVAHVISDEQVEPIVCYNSTGVNVSTGKHISAVILSKTVSNILRGLIV